MQIRVMTNLLEQNDRQADDVRAKLAERGVFALNLLGSPGAGKTTLLEKTIASLLDKGYRVAVIEGDLFTAKDAERIEALGVPVVQINTAGGCHLDAYMVEVVVAEMAELPDILVIENVGNLVCPAEFDLGEDAKAVVLSVTEGEDKPLKYPVIFRQAAAAVLSKVDLLPHLRYDLAAVRQDIYSIQPAINLLEVSAYSGAGMDAWVEWLAGRIDAKKAQVQRHG